MKSIDSTANSSFRAWLRLALHPREARTQARALAEGLHLAQAALDASMAIEAVLLRRASASAEALRLAEAAMARGAVGYELATSLFDRISPVEHGSGMIFVVAVPAYPLPAKARCDMLYLDGVQDPGNAGTLLRTAAAAGVREVLASPATAALWAPKTLRAGQGAQFRLRLHEQVGAETLPGLLDGTWIGAEASGGEALWSTRLPPGPVGWIFGAEGSGLSAAARSACGLSVSIPIDRAVESLNVAAAAALCLFERPRRTGAAPDQ
ncbi:MAG: RNA methyltransferase [Burkholderiales bacterium]|jgi:TrmH family RNA methyltransferase|nr:RNA methyltransferase [Burkholderiales bacterium]